MPAELYYQVTVRAGPATYDLSEELESFTLDEEEGRPDSLTLRLPDPYKILGHALREGMEVEVDLGTTEDHSVVFRGDIHQMDAEFPPDGVPMLTVQAYDRLMRLGLRQRNRSWVDRPLSSIVDEIGDEYGFGVDVRLNGDPTFGDNGIRQRDETDLAFLLRLAGRWACQTYASANGGNSLHFLSQRRVMTERAPTTLYYGRCGVDDPLISFSPRSDVTDIALPRVFSGLDYDTGEQVEVASAEPEEVADTEDAFFDENLAQFRAREPERALRLRSIISAAPGTRAELIERMGSAVREATPTFTTTAHIDARRENDFSTSALGMRASGSTLGNTRIRAQTAIQIEDVGGRFSGTWFLSHVRHLLDRRGYRTEFDCRR